MVKIARFENINWDAMRQCCIRNGFYTCGTKEDYENLMEMVNKYNSHCKTQPSRDSMLYEISNDIYNHSSVEIKYEWSVPSLMYYISKTIISISFSVEDVSIKNGMEEEKR